MKMKRRPSDRFRTAAVRDCIQSVLKEELKSKQYIPEEIPQLTRSLSETIKEKLKDAYIVNAMQEQKHSMCRADPDEQYQLLLSLW
ncbi:unnamed protein product [Ranitomeya imitator]|uniref:Tctex1 domain-containing protein 2 n=1 Tax=Ranitomeya imitator TaxID=111125 RepID=A0ABN9LPR0_9NEOB|nr:unnamed protein product [Ranitomeya imitator]